MDATQQGLEIVPSGEINWMERYAHKSLQLDCLMGISANDAAQKKRLYALYAKWVEESINPNTFAPDEQVDKTARARTGACAEELRKVLHGEEK